MKRAGLMLLALAAPALAGPLDEARSLTEEGRYRQARGILERTVEDPALEAQSLVLLARVCTALGDYACGVEAGERAVEKLPGSSEAHFRYARALRVKMSNVGRIKAMFVLRTYKKTLGKSIELDPRNVEALEEQIGFLAFAPGIAGGDVDEARRRVGDLERIDRRRGRLLLAAIESQADRHDEARRIYEEMLEADPKDPAARLGMGFLYQGQEKFPDADREFSLVGESGDRVQTLMALYQRARTRILGRYEPEKAVELLTDYIGRNPQDAGDLPDLPSAYWRLGNAHEQAGQTSEARRAYRRALELNPSHRQAKKALGELDAAS